MHKIYFLLAVFALTCNIIMAQGNVGIGTTSPLSKLDILTTDQGDIVRLRNPTLASGAFGFQFGKINTVNNTAQLRYNHVADSSALNYVSLGLWLNAYSFIVNGAGNVGIGTTTPVNKLDVEGGLAVGASYSGSNAAPTNGAIIQGNVGIGTNTPINKLDVEGGMAVGASYSGTNAAPTNGAIIQGNVGIGTTNPLQKFHVVGTALFAYGNGNQGLEITNPGFGQRLFFREDPNTNLWGFSLGFNGGDNGNEILNWPANSFNISGHQNDTIGTTYMTIKRAGGNVGLGTITPANRLDVEGGLAVGATYSGTNVAPTNGAIIEGNVGLGTTTPANKLDVEGGMAVGVTYSGTNTAPTNGAIIEGNVGLGTTTPANKLDVEGGLAVGANYSGTTAAPTDGAIIEGKVGIGTTTPASKLDVEGGMSVGSNYSGTSASPTNGAIIEGSVGIGTTSVQQKLDVNGKIQMRTGAASGYIPVSDANGAMTWTNPYSMSTGIAYTDGYSATEGHFDASLSDDWFDVTTVTPTAQGPGKYMVTVNFRCKVGSGTGTDRADFRLRAYASLCSEILTNGTGVVEDIDNHRGEYGVYSFTRVINLTGNCQYTLRLQYDTSYADDDLYYSNVSITSIKID